MKIESQTCEFKQIWKDEYLKTIFEFIENWGRGTNNIIAQCTEYGLPKVTFEYEWEAVKTTFYSAKPELEKNVGLNEVYNFIKENQPTKATLISENFPNVTQRTIERYIKQLKDENKIEFKGSPKTGGYWSLDDK